MDAPRQHHRSDQQGPHQRPGSAVVALRLLVLPEQRPVEVVKPVVVVGRHSEVELRLAHPDVSRRHCRLVLEEGLWRVHDLDSLNGLFVNGERLQDATLYEGDQIRVGAATLVVTAAPPPERVASGPEADVLRSIAEALPLTPLAG